MCRYLALTWAAHFFEPAPVAPGMHTIGLQAQDLYSRFSAYVRGTAPVILPMSLNQDAAPPAPNALPPAAGTNAPASEAGAGARPPAPNRGWFGRVRRRPPPRAATAPAVPQRKTQVVGDFIEGKQWGGQPSQQAKQAMKNHDSAGRNKVLSATRPPSSSNLAHLAAMPPLPTVNSASHVGTICLALSYNRKGGQSYKRQGASSRGGNPLPCSR